MNEFPEETSTKNQPSSLSSEQLFLLAYDELRRLARHSLAHERPDHTLQPTALVHEAYLRLLGEDGSKWDSRGHFFSAAAEAMRRILIENARRKQSLKRGGDCERQPFDEAHFVAPHDPDELLELDAALERFRELHPRKAELVKLRYFAGLTLEQASQAMGIGVSTADRDWAFARAWLFRALQRGIDRA